MDPLSPTSEEDVPSSAPVLQGLVTAWAPGAIHWGRSVAEARMEGTAFLCRTAWE